MSRIVTFISVLSASLAVSLTAIAQSSSQLPRATVDGAVSVNAPDNSSALVVDLSEPASSLSAATGGSNARSNQATAQHTSGGGSFGDDKFAAHVGAADTETAFATRLHDKALVVAEGTVIAAILETGIDSELPGFVRAVVSRDVCGFDGSTVLIPRGSRLIGQYRSGAEAGASRAFVIWSRLLTPSGLSIDIGSPATDPLGRGGLEGETNTHFLQRFGSAILLSVLTAGTAALTTNSATVVIGTSQQANNIAAIALQRDITIPTTITVPPGEALHVFVARDIDFSAVANRRP